MLSTKVYFVLKMYFHILRICTFVFVHILFVLYDIERYIYDQDHIFHTNSVVAIH